MHAQFAKNMDDISQLIFSLILLYKPCVCTLLSFFVVELLALAVVGLGIYLNYTKDGTLPRYLAPTANAAASASKSQWVTKNSILLFFTLLLFHKIISLETFVPLLFSFPNTKLWIQIFRNFFTNYKKFWSLAFLSEVISMKKAIGLVEKTVKIWNGMFES